MYIYQSHKGGLYVTDKELTPEQLYDESTGDSDWLVGEANTRTQAETAMRNDIVCLLYSNKYKKRLLNDYFGEGA